MIGFNQLRIFFGSSINTCSFSQEFFSSSTVFENVFQKEEETYDKGNKLREGNQWNTITQLHGKLHYLIYEPKNAGGTNTGMNPVELELSTLGASLQATAKQLAADEGFQYDQMVIDLEGDLDPRGFMGNPDVRNGLQEIRINYQVKTTASAEECAKFMQQVEQQSPIMDNLRNGVKIVVGQVTTK